MTLDRARPGHEDLRVQIARSGYRVPEALVAEAILRRLQDAPRPTGERTTAAAA